MTYRLERDLDRSLDHLSRSLAGFRAVGDAAGVAYALLNLGATVRVRGDLDRAEGLLEDSITRFETLGDLRSLAIAGANLGLVTMQQGRHERAMEFFVAALATHVCLGDRGSRFSTSWGWRKPCYPVGCEPAHAARSARRRRRLSASLFRAARFATVHVRGPVAVGRT